MNYQQLIKEWSFHVGNHHVATYRVCQQCGTSFELVDATWLQIWRQIHDCKGDLSLCQKCDVVNKFDYVPESTLGKINET